MKRRPNTFSPRSPFRFIQGTSAGTIALAFCAAAAISISGCVGFKPTSISTVQWDDRPALAILPFGFDIEITKLSAIETVDGTLSKAEESQRLADALQRTLNDARWLLLSRVATGGGFRIVPPEEVDALAQELGLRPGDRPTPEQLGEVRRRLEVDVVVVGEILDYGKVRWQWMAAGMFADISWETVVIGLASAWNPAIILGNVGFELLTSTPIWFGGGYAFGIAFRPVRVETSVFEAVHGSLIWKGEDASAYAWGELRQFPKDRRRYKELQLELNLAEVMESLGDALTEKGYTATAVKHSQIKRSWFEVLKSWLPD